MTQHISTTVRRRWRRLAVAGVAAAAVAAALTVTAASGSGASPTAAGGVGRTSACPFKGGQIKAFMAADKAGNTGDLGLGTVRSALLSVDLVNRAGGILGCKFVLDIAEEGFPDVDVCLRAYRSAIQSRKYDFYFGSTGSGCMASVTALTNAAKKAIIANQAADHQPFFNPKFQTYNFHAAVSTFLEGRASAEFARLKGWKSAAVLAPNYAYGQDAAKAFVQYFQSHGGKVVAQQFPEFNEKNFTPFINAVLAKKPQMIFSAFFAGFVIPFWKQWKEGGHDNVPAIGGLIDTPGWELVKSASQIPKNSYAYDRGAWQLLRLTPSGKQFHNAYVAKYGKSAHPVPLSWGQAFWSGVVMAKALVEKTRSLNPDDWVKAVEKGNFTFQGPFHVGPTPVDPVNHMADNCAQVGVLTYAGAARVKAAYNLNDFKNICMHDILSNQEARKLTTNPRVSGAALAAYSKAVAAVKQADRKVPLLVAAK
jgi:ABC-type branched-subunit amino acid transport system substrate-binding protein